MLNFCILTIKNLNFAPVADSDGYFCGGLFGYTYGAAVIKNLVLENITVTATGAGHNVGALVGFANNNGGKLTVSNVTVKNVTIDAPGAYVPKKMNPLLNVSKVVEGCVKASIKGRAMYVTNWYTKLQHLLFKLVPDCILTKLWLGMLRKNEEKTEEKK